MVLNFEEPSFVVSMLWSCVVNLSYKRAGNLIISVELNYEFGDLDCQQPARTILDLHTLSNTK